MPADVAFARAAAVYRELRQAIEPWAKQNGYKRARGAKAGWTRALDQTRELVVGFECSPWGSAATRRWQLPWYDRDIAFRRLRRPAGPHPSDLLLELPCAQRAR